MRRIQFSATLASALTILFGTTVVLGLLVNDNLNINPNLIKVAEFAQDVTPVLLQLVMITIGLTILLGIYNLLLVHTKRLISRKPGALYSLVLIISFLGAMVSYSVNRTDSLELMENVLVSVEAALAGLILFALVWGAYRMMDRDISWSRILFVVTLLIVLIGALPLDGTSPIREISNWLLEIPVSAGARGILIGIALATVVMGVRVLIGVDRSYRE